MGIKSKLFKFLAFSTVVVAGVLIGPGLLPPNVKFTSFNVAPTKHDGKYSEVFRNVERLFEDEIKGPEAFEVVNGVMYTTLHGGYVVKVFEDQVIPAVKFGEPCEGWWEESICGRPLGLKAYQDRYLIVADAYYGIFQYDTISGQVVKLVDKETVIDGKKPKIFNSVEVDKDGTIYWTHSSSDFSLEDGLYTFLSDGSGRLIKYDPKTHKNTVLMDNLYFANGVVLSADEDFLLVAETGHSRIHRYYLKGPKQSTSEVFIDGLPGMPDNLRRGSGNNFLVPLVFARDEEHPALFQVISPFPTLRKFFARFLSYLEFAFREFAKIYPNYYTKRALHYIGHLESVTPFLPLSATLLVVNHEGKIFKSYFGNDGSISSVSDVLPHGNYLYFGSPMNNYLGRIKLSVLGGESETSYQASPKVTRSPPSRTTEPPTTTTTRPPPTTTRPTTTTTRPPPTTTPPQTTTRPTTTTRPPPTTTRPPPTTTTRPPPPPTTRPPPTTTTRPPPPPTTRPPPTTTTRPPPPPTTRLPPSTTTRPPPPSTTPPPSSTQPPTTTTPKPPSQPSPKTTAPRSDPPRTAAPKNAQPSPNTREEPQKRPEPNS